MANTNKTYFLVSSWDFPPDSIILGSVVSSPSQPHIPLYSPEENDLDTSRHPTDKENYTGIVSSEKGDKAGLLFRFLDLFGVGAEASVRYDRKTVLRYTFRRMHTEWIVPSEELQSKAIKSRNLASYFRRTGYSRPVYMISGVKTVEGVGVTTARTKANTQLAFVGVEAGPVSVGPQGKHEANVSDYHTFENSSPIVFAFQLMEIRCDADGKVAMAQYDKGALLGVESSKDAQAGGVGTSSTNEITEDMLAREFGDSFNVSTAFDEAKKEDRATGVQGKELEDDASCVVVMPNTFADA